MHWVRYSQAIQAYRIHQVGYRAKNKDSLRGLALQKKNYQFHIGPSASSQVGPDAWASASNKGPKEAHQAHPVGPRPELGSRAAHLTSSRPSHEEINPAVGCPYPNSSSTSQRS